MKGIYFMSKLVVQGGVPLCGVLEVQGAKNSVLPIMAAALLADGDCIIEHCPDISDTDSAIEILGALGAFVTEKRESDGSRTVYINASNALGFEIPDDMMRKMRSSVMFLGAILSRRHRAIISFPGGCELGPRPIDLHISALKKMGADITEQHGYIDCECDRLYGTVIDLAFPSVGATENIMLAAVLADGETIINNAAKEPEIEDLQNFLNKMGAKICGAGSSRIKIKGVKALNGTRHRVIPDRIAAGTYLCAVAATRGNALIKNTEPRHLSSVLSFLTDCGCDIDILENDISVSCDELHAVRHIRTMPYPGFPTDMQAVCMALMTKAKGSSVFTETIFENRFKHVGELHRMGAKITTDGRVAVVEGVKKLYGARVESTDLRGGAALVVAALSAEGTSVIENISHIERGYENIEKALSSLGAKITRQQ